MSTLKADTIQNTSGGAVTLTNQSAAKAWCKHSMDTNVVSDGFNISSLTDQATGKATISLVNSMGSTTDYVAASGSASSGLAASSAYAGTSYPQNASSYWVVGYWSTTNYDLPHMGSTIHGDLA